MDRRRWCNYRSRSERISVASGEVLDEPDQQGELSDRMETNNSEIESGFGSKSCSGGSGIRLGGGVLGGEHQSQGPARRETGRWGGVYGVNRVQGRNAGTLGETGYRVGRWGVWASVCL